MNKYLEVLKFGYRFLKHAGLFLCVLFPLQLVGCIALAVYLPIKRTQPIKMGKPLQNQLQFNKYLRWFDNADIYEEFNRDFSTYWKDIYQADLWTHYYWLTIRNPLNYFGYKVLGIEVQDESELKTFVGDEAIGDKSKPGYFYCEFEQDGKTYYEYYWIKPFDWYGETRCFRLRLGWKLTYPGISQWVFVVSPLHSYSGV